jgi:hypothetical protein
MTNRSTVVLITIFTALALGAGGVWVTDSLRSVPLLAIAAGLSVWALIDAFEWRPR